MNRVVCGVVAAAAAVSASSVCLAVDTPESEPNESRLAATVVAAMAPGDTISGTCQGVGTAPGLNSLDTWDITTTAAGTAGIYEYRLEINESTSVGRTLSLRGFTQANGVISTTDIAVLNVPPGTAHFIKWYGNEQPSRVYLRLTGTGSTTAPYIVTLQRFPVTPTPVPNPVEAGPVYITTVGQTSINTDLWLYDASLNAIPGAGNDNETVAGGGGTSSFSRLQRSLSPGNYILAIAATNLANNLPSPSDDGNDDSPVLDFPNAICTSTAIPNTTDLDFVIGNRCSGASQSVTNTALFMEVKFCSFTVAAPVLPDPVVFTAGGGSPAAVGQGFSTLLSVTASGVPTTVTVDLSAFGLASSEGLHDDGMNGDTLSGDNIWSYLLQVAAAQPTGVYPINVTGTVSNGCVAPSRTFNLNVTPPNNTCANAVPIAVGGSYPGTTLNAVGAGGSSTNCNTIAGINPGVWYTFTETSPTPRRLIATLCDPVTNFDAQLVLYTGSCGAFSCVWGADTSGFGCPFQNPARDPNLPANTGHSDIPSMVNWSPGAPGYKCTIPGQVYFLCVLNRVAGTGGNFVLHFEDSGETCESLPPAHDACIDARPLPSLGSAYPVWDLIYRDFAAADPDVNCNAAANTTSRAGIWYRLTPTSSGNLFHAKIPDQTTAGSNFDSVVTVFSAAPDCSSLTEVACVDAVEGYVNRFTTPIAALTAGTTYYIEVSSQSATAAIPGGEYLGFNYVTGPCPADFDNNGVVTPADVAGFVNLWFSSLIAGTLEGDFDANGAVTPADVAAFVNVWFTALQNGC